MTSFTYCVSRYSDQTALSVFVSLHIPIPRLDGGSCGISVCQATAKVHTGTRRSSRRWWRAARHRIRGNRRVHRWLGEPRGPGVAGRGTTGRKGRLAHRRRSGGKFPPYPCTLDPRTPDPRARHRDRIFGHLARSRAADDGELITVEHNPETAAIARKNMEKTGVATKVKILVGDAQGILKDLKGPFD